MKVLLINPPGWVGDRIPLGYDLVPSVPLGLGYLASTMESEGITAKIVDMDWGGFSKEELVDMISKLAVCRIFCKILAPYPQPFTPLS